MEKSEITDETLLEQIREKYELAYEEHGPHASVLLVELLKDLRAGAGLEYWLSQGVVKMRLEGEFPEHVVPDTFRVEKQMGTYVLLKDGMRVGSGQLAVGISSHE